MSANPLFDFQSVFFSSYGSYISFVQKTEQTLALRHIKGAVIEPDVFTMSVLQQGKPTNVMFDLSPTQLQIKNAEGYINLCFERDDVIRISGADLTLRFHRRNPESDYDTAWHMTSSSIVTNLYSSELKCQFHCQAGELTLNAPWLGVKTDDLEIILQPDGNNQLEAYIQTYLSTPSPFSLTKSYDEAHKDVQSSYSTWCKQSLNVSKKYDNPHELATYMNWASIVSERGNFYYPTMLMSKGKMTKIWGWDNCFNAIAHIQQDPELAWEQILLFIDHQNADGALPDHITDTTKSFRFYKPPVIGWTIQHLQARSDFPTTEHLKTIYAPLVKWTNWWFDNRDDDKDGLPQYNHGNESGWDNGTSFAKGLPIESPDLSTYLIIQMTVLSDIAKQAGKIEESQEWVNRANDLKDHLISELWDGEQFRARHALTHEFEDGNTLLGFKSLLLGDLLPQEIQTKLIEGVKHFVTDYGVATERPDSKYYESDGYWRGPIWAPSTFMIVDGLKRCGAHELAQDIARRFCDMGLQYGMAENYDALTGIGLRDKAYTWTSSVFLLFANDLMDNA